MPRSPRAIGLFAVLVAVVLWGGSYAAIKAALAEITPLDLVAGRLLIALPFLLALAACNGKVHFPIRHAGSVFLLGLVLFLHFYIMSVGMRETSASHSAWILTLAPIFTAILGCVWLGERPRLQLWLGMFVAGGGVLLLDLTPAVTNGGLITSRGNLLVLATCVTWAVYTILMKRLTSVVPPISGTLWTVIAAAVIFVPIALFNGMAARATAWSVAAWWEMGYLGVGCLAIAFWCWSEGLRRFSAAESSLFLYLEPLITVIVAWLLLNEQPTGWLWLSAAAIASGVQIAEWNAASTGPREVPV